jgi:hypothetical protein
VRGARCEAARQLRTRVSLLAGLGSHASTRPPEVPLHVENPSGGPVESSSPHAQLCEQLAAFLARELGVAVDSLPRPGPWSRSGLTIGALSLRLDALTLENIDAIIEQQAREPKLFGELAVKLGFLSTEEVARLLEIQQMHWALELGEMLVLAGLIDLPRLAELLARFLAEHPLRPLRG